MLRAVELAPPVRAGTGAAAAASSSSSQRISFSRRGASGAIRASPESGRSEAAAELPAPLLPNARRRGATLSGTEAGSASAWTSVMPAPALPSVGVLKLRGQKLELTLLDMAGQQEADELIIGLPVSADGRETPQSNKVRSVVGRLAVQAAERGLRVYLQDEHGTSIDALDYMISRGVKKSARNVKSDAYAAVIILARYFKSSGHGAQIVLPRQQELQDKLIIAHSRRDAEI